MPSASRFARRRLPAALAAAGLLSLASCGAPTYRTGWDDLRRGMSEAEVEALLGPPRARWTPSGEVDPSAPRPSAWWSYGATGLLGMKAAFDRGAEGPQGDAYVVWFDEQGRVVDFQRPVDEGQGGGLEQRP